MTEMDLPSLQLQSCSHEGGIAFHVCDLDLDLMTFIYELVLAKNKLSMSRLLESESITYRQTDATEPIITTQQKKLS